MAESGTLGQILLRLGKIDEEQVNRALEHQSRNGGFFGEALLALEMVSPEELEWGLASQFDLPYIFPDPESIDPEAANMVSPEWALANLSLPITRAGDTITVVVDSPLRTEIATELRERTGLEVQLALASSGQIRELIRQVYARATAREEEDESPLPMSLEEAVGRALGRRAQRFGISAREHRAWFWFDDSGTIRRRPLDARWQAAMDGIAGSAIMPELEGKTRTSTTVELTRDGGITRAELRYMADDSGREFLFLAGEDEDEWAGGSYSRPGEGILTEVRLLARTGSARFVVTGESEELVSEVIPHLPTLFFEPSWRSVHVHDGPGNDSSAFSVHLPEDSTAWSAELESLRAFHFDVITAELGGEGDWLSGVLDVASVAFIRWGDGADAAVAREAGVRWRLHVRRMDGDHLDWSLNALES